MFIIDGQIHIWWADTPERPLTGPSWHGESYTIEAAFKQIDSCGVQRAVLVPPGAWCGYDSSYALEAVARYPDRFAVMGQFDFEAPDARERLRRWRDTPGMLGIRPVFFSEKEKRLLDESNDWFWAICEEEQMPLMCLVYNVFPEFEKILVRHPKLRAVIDHAGRRTVKTELLQDEAAWANIDEMLALARFPNVTIKVSSMPCFTTQPYPFPNLHKPVRQIYDAFGPRRMIWGSDITRLRGTYMENLKLFTEAIDFLSTDDKEWIMGRACAEVCNWPI